MLDSLFLLLLAVTSGTSKLDEEAELSYTGYKVYRVTPSTEKQLKILHDLLRETDDKVDFWHGPLPVGHSSEVMISPSYIPYFLELLTSNQIPLETSIDDVQIYLENIFQNETEDDGPVFYANLAPDFFRKYQRWRKIYSFLNDLVTANPRIMSKRELNKTYTGKELILYKIGSGQDKSKPIIWIDAGLHAREWIAPATAVYIAYQLVHYYDQPDIKALVDKFDWYILPLANPDGYHFSTIRPINRMWRKNRSQNSDGSRGVDLNRNFGYKWGTASGESIKIPSSFTYQGPKPFSEIESQTIANFLRDNKEHLSAYVSLHSFGEYWLSPWAYTDEYPDDYEDMMYIGEKAVDAVRATIGIQFASGTTAHRLYVSSGFSIDWVYGELGLKYAYVAEIGSERYKFHLPQYLIVPTSEAIWQGVKAVAKNL